MNDVLFYDGISDGVNVLILYWMFFFIFIVIMFGYVILMLYVCIMIKGCIAGIMYYVVSPRNIQKTR
jgi:hypothetical protein